METFGIGTDASMATHINNICEREYVTVQNNRKLVPSKIGLALVHGYIKVDKELVHASMRSKTESQTDLIAKGNKTLQEVLDETLMIFKEKYKIFVSRSS